MRLAVKNQGKPAMHSYYLACMLVFACLDDVDSKLKLKALPKLSGQID